MSSHLEIPELKSVATENCKHRNSEDIPGGEVFAREIEPSNRSTKLSPYYSAMGSRSFNRQAFYSEDENPAISHEDRRFAFTRQASLRQSSSSAQPSISIIPNETLKPSFSRSFSNVYGDANHYVFPSPRFTETASFTSSDGKLWKGDLVSKEGKGKARFSESRSFRRSDSFLSLLGAAIPAISSGSRPMKRLFALITLNIAYSTLELLIGLFTGRVGLVSDAFHLTFGCGVLSFSLFAIVVARKKPDEVYTYGEEVKGSWIIYIVARRKQNFCLKGREKSSKFWKDTSELKFYQLSQMLQLFLLFLSFSLAVEALHAFMQDESEHKHYLIISAVANLFVNLLGVWFFRGYARIHIVYRKSEDMNYHSVCLHVLSDSIRSAGLILASWLLSLGIKNAELLCLGLVSIAVFVVVMPLFEATAGILLQMAPSCISPSAFNKCLRQINMLEDVSEVTQVRFWEIVPGFVVGTLLLQLKCGSDEQKILTHIHSLYNDIGVKDLTVQTSFVQV